ncbi:MAG: hypothetical protein GF353_14935 [Candidatus Lokiarchaeota archaeon]|nr:hypothetical protein [Candidatus Lokiarchaeota archaeon]
MYWLVLSFSILVIPYPIYIQRYFENSYVFRQNSNPRKEFGIWTYGTPFSYDNHDEKYFADNETLEMLAENDIYLIYGMTENKIKDNGENLIERIGRIKAFGIETHISILPTRSKFVNIWTFERLVVESERVIEFLDQYGLIGDPITTFVYDMESIPEGFFPYYEFSHKNIEKLDEYAKIQDKFEKFNKKLKNEYQLDVRICTESQLAIDKKDDDNDLERLLGIMEDNDAKMSYMVYRRNNLGQNLILDHCRLLKDGDTIILNAWKDVGYLCWKNLDCAIQDARLVLGYPDKRFRLEIWELSYFLLSFGKDGLFDFVDALNIDSEEWSPVTVWNFFPFSFFWDMMLIGFCLNDLYGPIFRFTYRAF